MKPHEWQETLAPHVRWQDCYPKVAAEVRETLERLPGPAVLSTTELVEKLWPEVYAKGDAITVRKRLFKALAALAPRDLSDCATRGPERQQKRTKKLIRPWLWHKSTGPDIYSQVAAETGVDRETVKLIAHRLGFEPITAG